MLPLMKRSFFLPIPNYGAQILPKIPRAPPKGKKRDTWERGRTCVLQSTAAEKSVDCYRNCNLITISPFPLLLIKLSTKVAFAHFVVQIFKSVTIIIFCLLESRETRKLKLLMGKQNFSSPWIPLRLDEHSKTELTCSFWNQGIFFRKIIGTPP